jgi:thioesterase domain-containing protein
VTNLEPLQRLLDKLIRLRVQLWLDGEEIRIRCDGFLLEFLQAELAPWQSQLRQTLSGQTSEHSCLMPLVPDNGARRIYTFHALQGSLTEYRYVAQALVPDACTYGFQQPPGVQADSILTLAGQYCDAILRHRSRQPFALYGVSAGGLIAIEVARLLEQAGLPPDVLLLGDTFDPAPSQLVWETGLGWYAWVSFVDAHCGRAWLALIGRESPFWKQTDLEKLAYLAAHREGRFTASWSTLEQLERIFSSFVAYCRSYEVYEPAVPTVQCVYISASDTAAHLTQRIRSIVTAGRCASVEVAGRHLDLVRPSGSKQLAATILSAISTHGAAARG